MKGQTNAKDPKHLAREYPGKQQERRGTKASPANPRASSVAASVRTVSSRGTKQQIASVAGVSHKRQPALAEADSPFISSEVTNIARYATIAFLMAGLVVVVSRDLHYAAACLISFFVAWGAIK